MAIVKVSELSGKALDYAVALCDGFKSGQVEGKFWLWKDDGEFNILDFYNPQQDWAIAGPIIEREWLDPTPWPNESREDMRWHCHQYDSGGDCGQYGPTLLIAAMLCYVASKIGEEIDIPDNLL